MKIEDDINIMFALCLPRGFFSFRSVVICVWSVLDRCKWSVRGYKSTEIVSDVIITKNDKILTECKFSIR